MAQLALYRDFLTDFAKLEKTVQMRVSEAFEKFENAVHAGAHLEKISGLKGSPFRTIRIDRFWRGVVLAPESGDTYTLLAVLPHDDAYEWVRRRRASVNTATGRIEIRDVAAIDASMPQLERMASKRQGRLFDHIGDADMRRLGVDEQTLAFARALTDDFQLEAARALLPQVQWEVLYGLAAGMSPEDVWQELGAAISAGQDFDTEDLDAAVRRSGDRVLLVDGPSDLLAVLADPFELWRIYLHPAQRSVVEATYRGPARVGGGPGTGKTVVALHRAFRLAQRGAGMVLLTTFTSTLAEQLERSLRLLAESSGDTEALQRVRVEHVDRLAHRVFRAEHGRPTLLDNTAEQKLWEQITAGLRDDLPPAFLAEEWRQVVLARRVSSAPDYLAAKRTGRGRALNPTVKSRVWQAVDEFRRLLDERGLWTHETVCEEAERLLTARAKPEFRHVVVDEAQDLGALQWRLLRAAAPEAGDDLFITGDTHQRVYGPQVTLSEVGVNIRGRSTKLRVNYRTTAQILGWSLGVVRGEPVDDLDGGLESLAGYRSEMRGAPPQTAALSTWERELDHLASTVRQWREDGVLPGEIGVAARSNRLAEQAAAALERTGVPVRLLARSGEPSESIAVGTMHRMKGLEFRCLAVVGAGADHLPAPRSLTSEAQDSGAHARDLLRERCLLYVACTRARERLSVTWHGAPSPFLADLGN
ncbi:AAA family ATPase [Spiractinospora alimapuensis]|uniref:UvrD-helicase domain-containing protein n=1 Tax=Spiractinospora alimapuensis TaxID=2820884 RepID=UPI001F2E61F4|nr:UvrD-helicase domain-containing protein [Spiractinospora alimapuensis]QVQ53166.1 AAA family ATPase [Spiractinospora alimapuensis]